MTTRMQAVVLRRYGTPDDLVLQAVPRPVPGASEVLVRVHAASVNDWDWGNLRGYPVNRLLNGVFKPKLQILGCDVAGRVEAVGAAVSSFRPGDDVYGDLCVCGFGAFAEYACAPDHCLAHMPNGMSFEQAAAIPQAGMLAVQSLVDAGHIRPGLKLLLNGAGGGVGTFALQIAKLYPDVEVTVVDKAGKLGMLRALGADRVIDYCQDDFTRRGERYDRIIDVKTNRSAFAYARALAPGGAYVTVGGSIPRMLQLLAWRPVIAGLYHKHMRMVVLKPNKDLAYFSELFAAGQMAPVIDSVFQLSELAAAFRRFGTGDHMGKIIVTMSS